MYGLVSLQISSLHMGLPVARTGNLRKLVKLAVVYFHATQLSEIVDQFTYLTDLRRCYGVPTALPGEEAVDPPAWTAEPGRYFALPPVAPRQEMGPPRPPRDPPPPHLVAARAPLGAGARASQSLGQSNPPAPPSRLPQRKALGGDVAQGRRLRQKSDPQR